LASPSLDFMYISASAPEAPPLSDTTIGCFIRLFFWIAACIIRAIWSEAPPAPAATTISTGLVGCQAAIAGALASMAASAATALIIFCTRFLPYVFVLIRNFRIGLSSFCAKLQYRVQVSHQLRIYEFRSGSQNLNGVYLPFQLGVRLLR